MRIFFLGAQAHPLLARRDQGGAFARGFLQLGAGGFGAGLGFGQHFGAGLGGVFKPGGKF